jgi:predicted  nucleic acid-binding Zn-ribbon protein
MTDRIERMQSEIESTSQKLETCNQDLDRVRTAFMQINSDLRMAKARYEVEGTDKDRKEAERLQRESDAQSKEMRGLTEQVEALSARLDYARDELKAARLEQRKAHQDDSIRELTEMVGQVITTSESLGQVMLSLADAESRARECGAISYMEHLHDPSYIHEPYQDGRTIQQPILAQYLGRLRQWQAATSDTPPPKKG